MVYSFDEIRRRVAPIAARYHLRTVYLFGSYARGEARPDSDVDLLVDLSGTDIKGMFALSALFMELEEALQKPIDLVTVSALMQTPQMPSKEDFRNAVMNESIELYAAA